MRRNLKGKVLLTLLMCCLIGMTAFAADIRAASYPFEKYYNPDEDEWANMERVTMDGQLEFTVPDMSIASMDLIVYGTDDPKIQTLKNEKGKSVEFKKKYGDDSTYTYYTVSDVEKGDWKLKLREGSWESTSVYLIYYSSYTARYTIEKELKNPDSGNYQALIRLYDAGGKVLKLKNRKISYLIDDRSLMSETTKDETYNCYLGQAGLDEDDRKILGDDYSCHIIVTAEDGNVVLTKAEKADKKEFKEIKSAYTPSLWQRFRAKSAEEQKTLVLIAVSLVVVLILGIFILKKTNIRKHRKEKMEKEREERYQEVIRDLKRLKDNWQKCIKARKEILDAQEELESYDIWVQSILPDKKRKKYTKLMGDELFDILKKSKNRAESVKADWDEMRQTKKRLTEAKEKEFLEAVHVRGQIMEEIAKKLTDYSSTLCQLKNEISEFQDRKMFHDISIHVSDRRNHYSGMIEAQELGMPRRRGIQNLNDMTIRGSRKMVLDDLELKGLNLAIGFTQNDKAQEMILISNKELYCDEEDMELLRKEGPVRLGPYQYMQMEGLNLYTEDNQKMLFRIEHE
ncbi:MAG: hypothetical protein Q4E73_01630 [Lachnospiraceae bacterium]|nr:hypothetical protein [Lachnospiraceae bacterium]